MSARPRLQTVLDLRRGAEDTAKRALGDLERGRAAILAERAAIARDLEAAANAPVPGPLREQLAAYAAAARAAAIACDRRRAEQDKRIDAARDELAAAHRAVRAIEALQQRDRIAAARSGLRREGRANDEAAARAHQEALP